MTSSKGWILGFISMVAIVFVGAAHVLTPLWVETMVPLLVKICLLIKSNALEVGSEIASAAPDSRSSSLVDTLGTYFTMYWLSFAGPV